MKMLLNENEKLTEQLKKGEIQGLKKVYELYWAKLVNFSFGMLKSKELAEEVVQDVFVKVWENRKKLDTNLSLNGFIFTVTKRIVLNELRKKNKEVPFLAISEETTVDNSLEDTIQLNELSALSDKALTSLPPRRREIFRLRVEQGLTNKEIAMKLGVSIKFVEKQMGLAIKTVRNYLQVHTDIAISTIVLFMVLCC